jgi:hypothetical protein
MGALLAAFVVGGCAPKLPPEPTLAPTLAATPSPTSAPTATFTAPAPPTTTAPPLPTPEARATFTPSASPTLTTLQQTAQAPVLLASATGDTRIVTISEAQINAALAAAYQAAPLPNYTEPPRVTFTDGALALTMRIVPQGPASAPANPRGTILVMTADLAVFEGALELQPGSLEPFDGTGISTLQVKLAHRLLLRELDRIARSAPETRALLWREARIEIGTLRLTGSPASQR